MKSVDKLRALAAACDDPDRPSPMSYSCLMGLADEIEREHGRDRHAAVCKAHADGERNALCQARSASVDYQKGYSAGVAEAAEHLGEWYVKLPVGADGVAIHVGDDVYVGDEQTKPECVTMLLLSVDAGWEAVITDGSFRRSPRSLHHYHEPTVEDVLREFTDAALAWSAQSGSVAETGMWGDMARPFIDKLRLAGDE